MLNTNNREKMSVKLTMNEVEIECSNISPAGEQSKHINEVTGQVYNIVNYPKGLDIDGEGWEG